jgi:Resolvase, N terminal domain
LVTRILRPSAHPVLDRAYANTTGAVAFLEGLRSLGEQIDTSSAAGRLVLHLFGALAEFERSLMRERTMPAWRPHWLGAAWAAARPPSTPRRSPTLRRWRRQERRSATSRNCLGQAALNP